MQLTTADFQPVTAIQVSAKGSAFLKSLPAAWCSSVDRVIFGDRKRVGGQLRVRFTGKDFALFHGREAEAARTSTVTVTEDVSYVSSAFLPQCLRDPKSKVLLKSAAHMVSAAAAGVTNVKVRRGGGKGRGGGEGARRWITPSIMYLCTTGQPLGGHRAQPRELHGARADGAGGCAAQR